uniref:Uncharacterized protein n=1 Tax=Ackermannviridae sp. TaxID=2831612 RepID=A0A8S5RUF5_9CAUD|nr:MAG TPA: hypothetical protein [Ackermannviridae sp.]
MAKVSNREDALLNAYLNRYKNAQASTVNEGQNKTQTARAKGAALLNATDKTLPVLKNTFSDTLQNIVQGASLENSLNNDVLNRQMNLAQAKFKQANDLYEQQKKAQQYAEKQAEKEAAAAAKAARSGRGSGKSRSGKAGSSTGSSEDAGAAMDALFGEDSAASAADTAKNKSGNYDPKRTNADRNASARARYDGSKQEKADIKDRAQQKAERTAQMLKDKQAAANAGANKGKAVGKSYAEQKNAGNAAAQPAQSRAVTRGGKVIGSSYAAAGGAPSAEETQAAKGKRNDYKSRQEDTAAALKKLQTDAGYRAELAAPGRKLTTAEVAAVNQYEKSTKNTGFRGLKRVFETAANKDGLSQEDYAKKTAAMNAELNQNSALRGKAQMNGAGQTAQAFTAGLYDSVPFLTKSVDKLTDIANATGAELPQLSNAIEGAKSYDPLAAAAGTLVGKGMQYKLFNTAMEGTPLAQTMGKAGNAVVGQAQKIPVLGDVLGAGAGDALGRILTDTTADLALDTLPTLADDLSTYSDQQQAIANGETVDEALTPGKIAGNTAKNIAGNVAMNALPEIGGALFNRLKGTAGDAAQDALKQADNAVQDVQSAAPARNIVQPEANGTTGLAAQIQQMNTPDAANRSALNTLDELRGQVNLNGAQEKEAEQLRRAVLQRQQEIGDEAKLALQNSDSLPIDAQRAAGYNEVNGGVQNYNLGAGVRADVPLNADTGAGYEPQPGGVGSGLAGQTGTAGLGSTADGNGRGIQGPDAPDAGAVAEWAKSITGKDRRSVYTRRIEDLYGQLQSGATRESMADEAKDIAMGIVKDSDFAEPLDEATTTLREYFKNTPIRLDERAAGDILYSSGLKNIQQYNIQNGTNFSTTSGLPYDTALMELANMGTGVSGSGVDDLLSAVAASNRVALVDIDQAAATADYYRDMILDGPTGRQAGTEDFADWLEVQGFDSNMPDYTRHVYDRMFGGTDTADAAALLQDSMAQSVAARPLNGSESVHPNTVGSKEREMPYQEYAGRGHSVTDIDRDTLTPENQNILGTNAPYTVQRVSHAEQQANAQQIRSNEGLSATIDRIVKDSTSGSFNDETETLAGNTLRELNEKLNTLEPNTMEYAKTATQARIVRSKMREGLTKTARTLESAKQFTTPEKAVMNIEGILSDARDAAQKKNPGAFKKAQTEIENAVEGGRSEANAQLGEIVTNELSKIVGAGKQAAGNGNAGQAASVAKEVPVLDNPEDAWARAVARNTGNYARDNLKKADPDDLFAKEIVNQLFETAKESPVAQGARVKNGYTAQAKLNLAFDAQDDYATVWNKARAIAQKNYKNNPDMTSRLQAFFDNVKDEGSLYSNKTVLSAFTENLKENDDTFRQLADRAAFGNKSEISRAANRLADAVEVPDEYRSSFLKTAEFVLANSKQLTGAQAHADGRAFRAALNRAGFTVGDIADASAFGNDISPVMAAHEIMETLNPPAEYRQTVFDNVYNYIKNNDGYQKQMENADSRVLRRLVSNVDGGYTSIANKAAFGSDAGMQATVSDFLDEINAPTSLRGEMGDRLQKAITGNTQYQKAAAGADSRVFNEAVRHVQEELEFTFQKLSGESDASKAKVLDGLKNTITDYLGVDDNQAAEVVQNIEKMYNSALSDGAMKRLAQIFPDTNKTVNAPRDQFLELLRSGAYNDEYMGEAVKDLAATKFGIQQLSDEQVANIKQLAEQMETLPKDSKARVDIENEIATIAAGNVKGSFWDKWNAMRYTGMLFNAVTNIKNAVNNVGQGTLALLKDGVNGAVQRVAKAMGNDTAEVTVGYLNPASKADRDLIGRAFADTENSRWRQLTGASENFEIAKAARNAGQTFNTRVMRTIDQMSSAMLEDADVYGTSGLLSFAKPLNENNPLRKAAEFAQDATKRMGENGFIGVAGLKNNYSRYLASYLKAHGATDAIFDATDEASKAMLEQARDYAVQQALVNTYHEANVLTDFIGSAKKSANKVPLLGAWVEGQLPFVKTPTNVGIQAWRYSPGGLMQGLLQMGYDAAKEKDINKAMDTFSAGLTGSAIAGLGAYLWSTGHLVPGMTDEEKAEADLTGAQENSMQFTDENGKLHSYTINWFSNWAGPMMVGANLAKMWDTRNDNSTSVVDKVLNACVSVLDPVIDNSYLSSLNNTIDQLGNAQTGGEKAATLFTSGFGNYFTQAIPTLSGQLTRTIDPTRRSTYTGLTGAAKNFAYFGRKSQNKIPVLSQSNEPYIDVWGNEEKNFTPSSGENAADYAARAAYNFLSPGYYSESDGDEVSQYVEELYKNTGDKNVLPKNSSARGYTVSVPSLDGGDSTEQRLTPQEKTAYDKAYGQTAYDLIDELRQNSMFLQLPEDQQSALVQDAYTVAKTAGGVAAVGDGVSGVSAKEYEAYRDGGAEGFSQYVLMKNATDLARDEKRETSGNDDAKLNAVETWDTLYSQFGDDAVSNFVDSADDDSAVHNIKDLAGDKAVTAYMQAYSAVAKTLDDGQTPDKFTVGYGMQRYGLSGDDFARAYLAAYYKKDKNGKYPEKGGTYADKAGAEIYQSYGADALRDWVNYRATIPDTNGNGKVDKGEAMARLNEMDLTNELRRAYLTKTNKQWKNPY